MTRVVYVNGQYTPYPEAAIHVEDRGFQFADGVYEVCEVLDGQLVDERRHLERLSRSLSELSMDEPMDHRSLGVVMRETVRRNRVRNGIVYVQVTRGVARRDFAFPKAGTMPSVVCFARPLVRAKGEAKAKTGVAVITVPDIRWKRVDIKTTGLLAQSMARQKALDAGAYEAWMVGDDGIVTEGGSCNAWIVTADGTLQTHAADGRILKGITREVAMEAAASLQLRFVEKAFTVEAAKAAKEAFQTSASGLVMPVISIDGVKIGDGKPGPVASRLREMYHRVAEISRPDRLLT
jgi:D-alanine transaminase